MYRGVTWKRKKYLQICRIIDAINTKGNFCNIRKVEGVTTCNGCFGYREQLCCNECKHLTVTGCSVESIMCKISFCYMQTNPSEMKLVRNDEQKIVAGRRAKVVRMVKAFAKINGIPCYPMRLSMDEQFEKMKKL